MTPLPQYVTSNNYKAQLVFVFNGKKLVTGKWIRSYGRSLQFTALEKKKQGSKRCCEISGKGSCSNREWNRLGNRTVHTCTKFTRTIQLRYIGEVPYWLNSGSPNCSSWHSLAYRFLNSANLSTEKVDLA